MHDLAELIKALAWPCVALLTLLLFRASIVGVLATLAGRIGTADKVTISRDGLELEGRLAALEIKSNIPAGQPDAEHVRAANAAGGQTPDAEYTRPMAIRNSIPPELKTISIQYQEVDIADYAARVLRKNHLADEMGRLVSDQRVSRDLLAASGDEGLFAALATIVIAQPELADFPRLIRIAGATRRKHVQYRVVLAWIELLKRQFIGPQQAAGLSAALDILKKVDDPPLQNLILRTEPLLNTLAV